MTKSQEQAILDHLKGGQRLDPMLALRLFGCWALSSRVADLNRQGHNIKKIMVKANGKTYADYYMATSVDQNGQMVIV